MKNWQTKMTKIRLAAPLQLDSMVDGEGIRMVVWFQGCSINCPFCHNPETHNFNGGYEVELEDLCEQIKNHAKEYDGITFSGGHPLEQPEACLELAKFCRSINLNIWLYSGLTYDIIRYKSPYSNILDNIDILVDGPYINAQKSLECPFRGSKNQRIIDINETRKKGEVILWKME